MGYYCGRIDSTPPVRLLVDDIITETKKNMLQALREMEERLNRHINECKREIMREFNGIKSKREELREAKRIKKAADENIDTDK